MRLQMNVHTLYNFKKKNSNETCFFAFSTDFSLKRYNMYVFSAHSDLLFTLYVSLCLFLFVSFFHNLFFSVFCLFSVLMFSLLLLISLIKDRFYVSISVSISVSIDLLVNKNFHLAFQSSSLLVSTP